MKTYDTDIDTVSQVMIDFIIKRLKKLPDFDANQIYESTLLIDEKTPLPCIGLYRNRITPYDGKDLCIGRDKYNFEIGICYFTNPTSIQYYNYELYHFEEKVLLDMTNVIQKQNYPNHITYPQLDKNIDIENINFKSSNITTIVTNGSTYNWANMVRLLYNVEFSVNLLGV